MDKLIILLIIIFLFLSCIGQNRELKQEINIDSLEIIDPVVSLPYEIKNRNQSVTLPETLGGKNMQGYAFIQLQISNNAEILETFIMKLSLKNWSNNKAIDYNVSQGSLPSNLNEYVRFFDEYCKKKIILEKRGKAQPKNIMQIRLTVE